MNKILVVEDEEQVRENIVELLENEDFEVAEAENALVGLKYLQKELPDLILSDIMMPYFNGFEFYEKVRQKYLNKNIPFLFLSARMDEDTMKHAMEIGADDFITKPYKAEDLLKRITSRLEKKQVIDGKFEKLKLDIAMYVPHELKTPLIPVLGLSEMLLNDFTSFTDDEKLEMIASIHRSALRFKERIEKFTKYSELKTLETDAKKALTVTLNPAENVFRAKAKRSYHCSERYNDIEFLFEDAELTINETDFETMMFEFVENACKFSPQSTNIKITGKNIDDKYAIEIVSHGNKLNMDVFEGFHQTEKSNYQQIGNGLGFAIIRLILEKYKLKLSFNYDEQNRNIITISFPIK